MTSKISQNQNKLKKYLFETTANFPTIWLSKGKELKKGADVLLASDANHLYLFLIAFSFENLLKGILICGGLNRKIKLLTLRKWEGLGHDLLHLSKKSNISISNHEEKILKRLTNYSMWGGRYPIPVDPEYYPEIIEFPKGSPMPNIYFESSDPQTINKLYERFEKNLQLKIRYLGKNTNKYS